MISLKRYLDREGHPGASPNSDDAALCRSVLEVYCASLTHLSECGVDACPDLGPELVRGLKRIIESLGPAPTEEAVRASETAVRELLRRWGRDVASYHDAKTTDVRGLLLVMSRTAESLGNKDDRFARRLDTVTSQLSSITNLNDVSRMRASVEASARELKESLEKMTSEGKALIEHLRAEVSTYQTKLEKAERAASCDALTGLGSRHWVENRIEQRIELGVPFAIVLVDIDSFHSVVEGYGNLVSDLLLKEFARELRSTCRFTDIVGRWGGDEFIILVDDGAEIRSQLARLRTTLAKPYHVPGRTGYVNIPLDVSIGLAEYQREDDVHSILERADSELCRQRGRVEQQKTA